MQITHEGMVLTVAVILLGSGKTSGNISSVNRFWTPLEKNIKYLILKNTGHPVQTPIKLVTGIWHVNAFLFS